MLESSKLKIHIPFIISRRQHEESIASIRKKLLNVRKKILWEKILSQMGFPIAYSTLYAFIKKLEGDKSTRKAWTHVKRQGEFKRKKFSYNFYLQTK